MAEAGQGSTTLSIVSLAVAGDRSAANALHHRLRPRLLAWFAARLGSALRAKLDPEDLVQETLLEVQNRLGGLDVRNDRAFYAWLFRIAEHALTGAADHFGALKRDPGREVRVDSRIAASEPSPASEAHRNEQQERLARAIASLPETHREVLRLRVLELMDTGEVANHLGITPKNASVRYVRAVKALRAAMDLPDAPRPQLG